MKIVDNNIVKPVWRKPVLMVLVRKKPEETVLTLCKHDLSGPVTSDDFDGNCLRIADCATPCDVISPS